jgi:hypothetical protein
VPEAGTDKHSDNTCDNGNPSNITPGEEQRPVTASGWLEWFRLTNAEHKAHSELSKSQILSSGNESSPDKSIKQESSQISSAHPPISEQSTLSKSNEDNVVIAPVASSSWFNVWPGSASNKKPTDIAPESHLVDASDSGAPMAEAPVCIEAKRPGPGSTWAFWSKDSRRLAEKGGEAEEPGELAVTGEASQDNPAPAHATILGENKDDKGKKINKRGRQLPDDVQEPASKALHSDLSNRKRSALTPILFFSYLIDLVAPLKQSQSHHLNPHIKQQHLKVRSQRNLSQRISSCHLSEVRIV